jgi:hypothetical protein
MITPVHFSNEALMALEIAGLGDLIPDLERMADTIHSFSEEARLPPNFGKVAAEYRAQQARSVPTGMKWRAAS